MLHAAMLSRAARAGQRTMVRGVGMTSTEAPQGNLLRRTSGGGTGDEEPPWMAGFGALSDLAAENRRVLASIEDEFERLSPEDAT